MIQMCKVNKYYLQDSFEKTEIARYTTSTSSRILSFAEEEWPADASRDNSATEADRNRVSPVFTQRRTKKSTAVNKNLFPASDSPSHDNASRPNSLIDSYSFSDATLNALEETCENEGILVPTDSPTSEAVRTPATPDPDSNDSHDGERFDLPARTPRKTFVYPCEKVKKPDRVVRVDDILQSVLTLEQSAPIPWSPKSQPFPRGLISFNELQSQAIENEYDNCSLSLTACDELMARIEEQTVASRGDENRPVPFPVRFRAVIAENRDAYWRFKKYFEYHRVAFARTVWRAKQNGTSRRTITAMNYIESGQLKCAGDKTAIDHLNRQLRSSNVPFTMVVQFFDIFRKNSMLFYNFNIRSSVFSLFICDTRQNRCKKRNRGRLEFEENVRLRSCPASSIGRLPLRRVAGDVCRSPLRKIPRKCSPKNRATSDEDAKFDFFDESICREFFADFELDSVSVTAAKNEDEPTVDENTTTPPEEGASATRENEKHAQNDRLLESAKLDNETLELLFSEDICVDWSNSTENNSKSSTGRDLSNVNKEFTVDAPEESKYVIEEQSLLKKFPFTVPGNCKIICICFINKSFKSKAPLLASGGYLHSPFSVQKHGDYMFGKFGKSQEFEKWVRKFVHS